MAIEVDDVLVCARCCGPVGPIDGWLVWGTGDDHETVCGLRLLHKGCDRMPYEFTLSMELIHFADAETAVLRLADLHITYAWPAPFARQLMLIAWATMARAGRKRDLRARARETYARLRRCY